MDVLRASLSYSVSIGILESEKKIFQDIDIDFAARVQPIASGQRDEARSIRIDYFKADEALQKMLSVRHFNLIETVAEEAAQLLLSHFEIASVVVRVTKRPLGMPRARQVSYECERFRPV